MDQPSGQPSLIDIEIGSENSEPFKSIKRIIWRRIPPFAVLTGPNGSGKTQLLQALAYKLSLTDYGQAPTLNQLPLKVSGDTIGLDDIAYLPSSENSFQVQGSSIGNLQQLKLNFIQQLAPENSRGNIDITILRRRIERQFGIRIDSRQVAPQLVGKLPDDFIYMLNYSDVAASLSHVFLGYQFRFAQELMNGKSKEDISNSIGKAPWELVNEALRAAEFAYRVTAPDNNLLQHFQVRVEPVGGGAPMELNDLSSGEKAILRTILWFYNSKHNNIFPKLFLLDEPDAHLHPSMTRQFIDVLKNVLVDQYKVRVILTTHSPSTVALAPEDSIFVMTRGQAVIGRPKSKAEAIGLLTSGLVFVSSGTKFVLVEDQADVEFYSAVRDVLADQGPSKDNEALRPAPSLIFLPASIGKHAAKIGGGKNIVAQWVEKFDTQPLNEIVYGIIDLDAGNVGTERIYVTGRYTLENYQLDPFLIFGLLLEEQIAPQIPGVSLTLGDEHLLRTLPASSLQKIVDYVVAQVEPCLQSITDDERQRLPVTFTCGASVSYPNWMLTRPGHSLLPLYQRLFGQHLITPPRLNKSLRRLRMIPIELARVMANLQQGSS
ncbi:MAG: AAA family ATPase [Pseudomonadota bacterium]